MTSVFASLSPGPGARAVAGYWQRKCQACRRAALISSSRPGIPARHRRRSSSSAGCSAYQASSPARKWSRNTSLPEDWLRMYFCWMSSLPLLHISSRPNTTA